ncbi:RAQPRD family integrative conjugative element protein [Klebsiella pneumoniae]|uniref:integrative conjugative element protein, RAQPRD family n=1 Tax=Klebsiella pneumoniae TaxID=573 RepID=UPI00203E8E56|nr:RAQPRD family integrative conjugative element protein [Klebsiella pneumoniae]USB67191.1 conjugal transfer protein [Klebsiella pneumoniae]HBT4924896.1 conjugal transfer protein [Klebsiella pneumoniae]
MPAYSSLRLLLFTGVLFSASASAIPLSEQASLALLLNQLEQMKSTLQRAEAQASVAPGSRFFFDYPQAYADIRVIHTEIEQYLTPARAQPQPVLPLAGQYRRENTR